MEIRKAAKQKAKLRIGVSGPSGSGKTYSALLLAKGIASDMSKVLIIDTENGSADLYANLGDFNVIRLEAPYDPKRYIDAIDAGQKAGMEVIIIDSVSHEWEGKGGILEINDLIAKTKFKGNSWSAWSETTPRHQRFIEAIVTSPLHIITTARAKTDTIMTDDKKVKKVGTKEIQREGFEYELTLNFNVDRDGHHASASKDRTGMFIDKDPFVITVETGKQIKEWAEAGVDPILPPDPQIAINKKKIMSLLPMLGVATKGVTRETIAQEVKRLTSEDLKDESVDEIVSKLEVLVKEYNQAKVDDKSTEPQI